ncbi:Rossmann-fold NAD(P)-binding domain-containing protein, partial [Geodermatophilus chilensis]|uniref:hypothetical protein n=1 Tax=Geodermatophilus chilensis TaxID=2035835 RepID=UPI0012FFF2AA
MCVGDRGGPAGFATVRLGEEARLRGFERVTDVRRRTYPDETAVTAWVLAPAGVPQRPGRTRR